ncbi:HTH-type transcriptional regulator RutR [Kushneria phyllosphaerae]|uniref:HTH-type transcriptional regulator RutR n=1 Tax=Kushneria phyllosphaerae TaxID=2100822 RepID=A0A2R8CN81_9GAMM|nr:HTH-type transcriptional regulator RutR [Kushneria phyllosphaerae]SPJ34234.1 HTH-type transcriptional regulator RutR [Kushneria phyllosphaerae]
MNDDQTRLKAVPANSKRRGAIEQRRAGMRQAALHFFSRFGLHGTSLDQVAERAGVSKTNLIYHYPTKEALYTAVLGDMLDLWIAPFQALQSDADALPAIRHYIRLKLELSRDHAEASRLYCLEMVQGAPHLGGILKGSLRALVDDKAKVIEQWVERGDIAPTDAWHLFYLLWATTQHYADFTVQIEAISGNTLEDPVFLEAAVSHLQTLIMNGLMPRPS